MKNWLFILLLLTISFSSCDEDDNELKEVNLTENNYLIFGHFYGECLGEMCVETFKLTSSRLYEDTTDDYYKIEPFNFVELGEDKFDKVKDLTSYFPVSLFINDSEQYGYPDWGDQGGYFIQYVEGASFRTWTIDKRKSSIPDFLHEFTDKVNEKIEIINQ